MSFIDRYQLTGHITKTHTAKRHSHDQKLIRIKDYENNPSFCKECKSILPYDDRKKKFCNSSCSASFNNRKRGDKKTFICENCGNSFFLRFPSEKRKYCSNKCSGEKRINKSINTWLVSGELNLSSSGQIHSPSPIKKYILEEQQNKCCICGLEPIWNERYLVFILDHIDGDATNNQRNNLRLVCPNCDSQLDTYKSKNKGKGRRSKGFSTNYGL